MCIHWLRSFSIYLSVYIYLLVRPSVRPSFRPSSFHLSCLADVESFRVGLRCARGPRGHRALSSPPAPPVRGRDTLAETQIRSGLVEYKKNNLALAQSSDPGHCFLDVNLWYLWYLCFLLLLLYSLGYHLRFWFPIETKQMRAQLGNYAF